MHVECNDMIQTIKKFIVEQCNDMTQTIKKSNVKNRKKQKLNLVQEKMLSE